MYFDSICATGLIILILYLMDFAKCGSPLDNLNYTNIYGSDYTTKWIYIPDGRSEPHYVNLRRPKNEDMPDVRSLALKDIEFRLYCNGDDTDSYIILDTWAQLTEEMVQNTTFMLNLSEKPLKMMTHGWKSSVDEEGVTNLKNAYLEYQDVNVITINWSGIADSIFYHRVASETRAVGATVATFIDELIVKYKVSGKQIHLIGHSLGAHVMGVAAFKSSFQVDRITGLDPARPLFEYPQQTELSRLDPSAATFVDVIHTCGGVLGYEASIGTADFYPNNGNPPQPGCENIQKIFEACSHGRSFDYFCESIKYPLAFPAYQCSSWTDYLDKKWTNNGYMGENASRNMSGKYYLQTKSYRPFGYQYFNISQSKKHQRRRKRVQK